MRACGIVASDSAIAMAQTRPAPTPRAAPHVAIGSYPFMRLDKLGTSIVARSTDKATIAAVIAKVAAAMRVLGGEPIIGPSP